MNTFQMQDFQKFGQASSEASVKLMGDWTKNWQAATADWTDYSKRAFQDGQATFEKLINAKTMEQIMEIQTSYARRSYEGYMQQMSKVGFLYSSMGREASKPVERVVQSGQTLRG